MTGAGAAKAAYAVESSYGSLSTPSWKQPFVDLSVDSVQLSNNLQRGRQPDDPRPKESREGPVRGSVSISGTMATTDFHELIFPRNSNTNLANAGSTAPTATWYFKSDLLSGTTDRFLAGGAVTDVTWNYQEGQAFTVDMTINFGAGEKNLSTPGSITQPAVSKAIDWHGVSFQINSSEVKKLQSLSMNISNMARLRSQQSRTAADAVVGAYDPTLSFQAIPGDETTTEYAYGSSGATSTEDTINKQSATLTVDNQNGTVATYNVSNAQPNDLDWNNLISDEDLVEVADNHITDIAVA